MLKEVIDWQQQWKLFAPGFSQGYLHLDLAPYGTSKKVLLSPGPGFGDLSHPTTLHVLKLMNEHVQEKTVVDLGCGSGILSLVAAAFGSKKIYAIDIDPEALTHTNLNAKLNDFNSIQCGFDFSTADFCHPTTILMNMISSEQKQAWQAHPYLHSLSATVITSGILQKERETYLSWSQINQWELIQETVADQWSAFIFKQK